MSHALADRCRGRIPAICARYHLPAPHRTDRLEGGSANINFAVRFATSAEHPPVKITFCLYKDLAAARQVARALAALDDAPIGRLIGAPDDVQREADRAVLVTAYAEGEPLDAVDRPGARLIGELLARLHRPPPAGTPPHDMNPARLKRIAGGDEGPSDADFRAFVADGIAADPGDAGLPVALIHGDLFLDNIIRGPDGALTAIDFEEACRAPRALDLAMTAVGFSRWQAFEPDIVTALIAGYTAVAPLMPVEKAALPALVDRAAVATAGWRRLGTPEALQTQARDWREMMPVIAASRRWSHAGLWRTIAGA